MNGLAKLNVLISLKDRISGAYNKVYNKLEHLQKPVANFKKANIDAFNAIRDEIPGVSRVLDLLKNPYVIAAAAAVALGMATIKATGKAMVFEEGMAKINSTAMLSQKELTKLRNNLMDIGKDSGGNFDRIPESFEKILSQVGNVDQSINILRASVKGAKAGFTDLDVVSGALAQSMSIIGAEKANAQEVLDTFFAAKRVGAGEFKDFANYLPTLIAAGKNLGIQYKDVAGLFAFMTGKGQDAASATMLMQNAFTALGKSDIQKGLAKAGVNVFDKNGMMRDMSDIMTDLQKRMAGMNDKQKSNFLENIGLRDVQAKNAISILTSDVQKLKETMDQVRNSTGETEKALLNTDNPMRTWKELADLISYAFTKIGYVILPVVGGVLKSVVSFIKNNWETITAVFDGLIAGVLTFAGAFVILKAKMIGAWIWNNLLIVGIKGLGTAIKSIPIIGWIALIVGAFTTLYQKSETFRAIMDGIFQVIKDMMPVVIALGKALLMPSPANIAAAAAAVKNFSFKDSYNKGYNNSLAESKKREAEEKANDPKNLLLTDDNTKDLTDDNTKDNSLKDVVGGGSGSKTFIINIKALNEGGINIKTTNLKEGVSDVEKQLHEMLLRTVRNTETAY